MFKLTSTRNDRASCLISTQHDTTRCMLLGFQHDMFCKAQHDTIRCVLLGSQHDTKFHKLWNMTRSPPLAMRQELPRCSFKHANSCLMYQFLSTFYLHPANFHQRRHSVRIDACPYQIVSAWDWDNLKHDTTWIVSTPSQCGMPTQAR